jgi:adenosine deaminase
VSGVTEPPDRAWVVGLPKAEVHLHLEGCVPPEVVGATGPAHQGVASLPELLSLLDRTCGRVERADQLAEIARQLVRRTEEAGVRHADVIVNPLHWPHWRRRLAELFDALGGPLAESEEGGGPSFGICPSISRRLEAQQAEELVDTVLSLGNRLVVGISIDGDESSGSHNERFAAAFRRAAGAGLHRCAHAGESSGPVGVREAVELLGAERIDHGVRCIEDPGLVAELAERRIPLDICPSSNVVLGIVPSLDEHPIEALRCAGVPVSVNTDDPLLYGIDLVGEYERCAAVFGWGRAEVASLARTSIESCFADPSRRAAMLAELDLYLGPEPTPRSPNRPA